MLTNRGALRGIIGTPMSSILVRAYCNSSGLAPSDLLSQGGDDLQFKVWDIRQGFELPIITNKRCVPCDAVRDHSQLGI
jgi:hypothetical protein